MIIRRKIRTKSRPRNRRGVITVIVAVSLVVLLACIALALDRIWLHSAAVELSTCAEAASLAAAGELASDDLLRDPTNSRRRIAAAREAAAAIALKNLVAGEPVVLDLSRRGDVRFGRIIKQQPSGQERFVETDRNPTSVVVTAHRTRSRLNPVALVFAGWSGEPVADVVQRAEATIDNRILGVRAFDGGAVPGLPLAILADAQTGNVDSWSTEIDNGAGADRFAFDPQTGRIRNGRDGIRELTLRSLGSGGSSDDVNVLLVDLGTGLDVRRLVAQIRGGWTADDLASRGGEVAFRGAPIETAAAATIPAQVARVLNANVGACRICLLYGSYSESGEPGRGVAQCVGLVAGRIMAITALTGGAYEMVFQPGVVTTRTAILADAAALDNDAMRNPYIYKLHLSQ